MKDNNKNSIPSAVETEFPIHLMNIQIEDEELIRKRHGQIIEAGSRLFSKNGYHSTTIRQIAKESGLGIGSIYQYVKNKEEILFLILEYILRQYELRLSQAINESDCPDRKLRTGIETYYRIVDEESSKVTLAYLETRSLSEPYRGHIKELELKTNKIFEEILKEGIESGLFNPMKIELVAYDIIMLGHMWALKRWFFSKYMTIEEYILQQVEFISKMVMKGGEL